MPVPRPVAVTDTPAEPVIRTLLSTDLVASTRMVEELGDSRASEVITRHDRVARDLLPGFRGREIDKTDGFLLLFERPIDALGYALAYHQTLSELSRELGVELEARAGIHLGEVLLRENSPADVIRGAKPLEVEGIAKPITARVMSLARGRQTLLTHSVFDLARRSTVGAQPDSRQISWLAHGSYRFKGFEEPIEIFEAGALGVAPLSVPPDTEKAHRVVPEGDEVTLGWRPAPDQEIPLRPNWQLTERLGAGGFGEVWLAHHKETAEKRVFKFCYEARRLQSLRREATLFRVLKESLGQRDDIARILDWNFDQAPYFLESEYTEGGSLIQWAERQGGLDQVPLTTRLELVAQAAEALAAAHSVGVLHKDVKPSNVLVTTDRDGNPNARLTDFGIGRVMDESVLANQGITVIGVTEVLPGAEHASSGGTQLYRAPELLEGKTSTVQGDIYALGVVLYQITVGDFTHALAPGWRRDVADAILAEDIARMVDGSPERRLTSASEVADRLRHLEQRRAAAAAHRAREKAHRRRRVLAGFGAVATVVLLVVSILAVQAIQARREADLRRGQAETLISFMLGDLRQKLEPQGRLDVLRDIGDEATAYFRAVPETDLSDRELSRWSEALHQIGDVRIKLGDLPAATEAFQESLRLARELADRDPGNLEWRAGLGASHFWLGHVSWRRRDLDGALEQFRKYLAISEDLVAREPGNATWQLELGYAHGNVGTILQEQGDLDAAREALLASLAIKQELAEAEPNRADRQFELADAHNKIGWVLETSGELRSALVHYRNDLDLKGSLVEGHPEHMHWQYRLAVSHAYLGNVLAALGKSEDALESFQDGLDIMESLVAIDPENSRWRRELAWGHLNVSGALRERGDLGDALDLAETSVGILETLVARDSTDSDWRRNLAEAHFVRATTLERRNDLETAITALRTASRIFEELQQNNPKDPIIDLQLGRTRHLSGVLWDRSREPKKARTSFEQAARLIEPWARSSRDRRFLDVWTRVLLDLGHHEKARSAAERLRAMGYGDREFRDFCREHGQPYPDPEMIR